MDLTTAKYDVSAFTGKNNFWFLIKVEFCEKKWIWMKKWNFEQKNSFFIKFQKMLSPESTMNMKISEIKFKLLEKIRKYATAVIDKEEYVITKGEDM